MFFLFYAMIYPLDMKWSGVLPIYLPTKAPPGACGTQLTVPPDPQNFVG